MVNFQGLRFHDRTPVYQQVAEHLKRQILLGLVEDGEPMPSRRELAAQTGINPNTAQKAYRLMTEEGLVRTEGNNISTVCLTPERRHRGGTHPGAGAAVRAGSAGKPPVLQKGHRPDQRIVGRGGRLSFPLLYECHGTQTARRRGHKGGTR